jgi:restriction system protein
MSQRKDSVADLLVKAPWWLSVLLAVLAYVGLRWAHPAAAGQDKLLQAIASGAAKLAPLAALLFGILAVGSALFGAKRRKLLDNQQSLETLRTISWKDFEFLVAEAYRRQGFAVEYSLGKGADGGVDLRLRKDGRNLIVQCKQWKVLSVGAPVIREMFGIMTDEKADEAIIVTSGRFTDEARGFASGKSIQLVDGRQLLELVKSAQVGQQESTKARPELSTPSDPPQCPRCGKSMVLRTARRGSRSGSQFWGCQTYPACKATLPAP